MRSFVQDLRYAVRQFRKSPGFTAAAVLTLALGIGASSAIFCLIDGLWMHPMSVAHPGRIVRLFSTTPQDQEGLFSYPEFQTMAQRATAFQEPGAGIAAIGGRGSLMPRPDGTSQLLLTNVVSDNFFSVLGVHPLMGRFFTAQDAALLRTHPAVVLGFDCWQKDFNGDPNIVGKQIPLRHGKDQMEPGRCLGRASAVVSRHRSGRKPRPVDAGRNLGRHYRSCATHLATRSAGSI